MVNVLRESDLEETDLEETDLEELASAVAVLERLAERFEPGVHDFTGNKRCVDLTVRGERFLASIRGRSARWMERTVDWKKSGHRNAADLLAKATGESVGAAARELETARRLETLPETADAFRAGELSPSQAAAIAEAASADPASEHRLLATARGSSSFKAVRDACREVTMRAEDDRAKAAWLHDTRAVNTWSDGHYRMDARLAPDDGAWVHAALEAKTDELFRAARTAGRRESRAAYRADALLALLRHGPSKPPEVRVHVDRAALDRGYALVGERCEIDGIGPVPVTVARRMLDDARVVVVGHDETGDITHISSSKRSIPAPLRRWVEEAYPCCGVDGCTDDWRLEIDHVVGVEDGGPTEKQNLWRLCRHHHQLKTYRRWRVVGPPSARTLVAPDDPDPPGDPP
jgi:hypothetical protein